MARIFISFREGDSGPATRLADQIDAAFHDGSAFVYTDAMPAGVKWADHIGSEIARADAFIAVVGEAWHARNRELYDPIDEVRSEIEMALTRHGLTIIIVTVDKVSAPERDGLPESLAPLLDWQVTDLPPAYFREAVRDKLLPVLAARVEASARNNPETAEDALAGPGSAGAKPPPARRRWLRFLGGLTLLAGLGLALLIISSDRLPERDPAIIDPSQYPNGTEPELGPVVAEVDAFRLRDGRESHPLGISYADGGKALWIGLHWAKWADDLSSVDRASDLLRLNPATAGETDRIAGMDRTPQRLDSSADGGVIVILGHSVHPAILDAGGVRALADDLAVQFYAGDLSDDGRILITSDSKKVRLWDVPSGKELRALPSEKAFGNTCMAVAVAPQSDMFATTAESELRLWRHNGTLVRTIDTGWGCPDDIAFAPDGSAILTVPPGTGASSIVDIYDVETGDMLRRLVIPDETRLTAAFLPGAERVATLSEADGDVSVLRLWDWRAGDVLGQVETSDFAQFAVSPDGRFVAVTGENPALRILALPR